MPYVDSCCLMVLNSCRAETEHAEPEPGGGRCGDAAGAEQRSARLREHFRQFSKFDTVSLDEVIGEDGFTLGAALGIL